MDATAMGECNHLRPKRSIPNGMRKQTIPIKKKKAAQSRLFF
jgi:hypothetical protein